MPHWNRHSVVNVKCIQLDYERESSGILNRYLLLTTGKITIWSGLLPKFNWLLWAIVQLFHKFYDNLPIAFWVTLLTNRQPDRQTNGSIKTDLCQMCGSNKRWFNTSVAHRSFAHNAPAVWISLPAALWDSSVSTFKQRLKRIYLWHELVS